MHSSPRLRGVRQAPPFLDAVSGLISCGWDAAWSLIVPDTWVCGYYVAVFTTVSGWLSYIINH